MKQMTLQIQQYNNQNDMRINGSLSQLIGTYQKKNRGHSVVTESVSISDMVT